jgi:hypothetical protein
MNPAATGRDVGIRYLRKDGRSVAVLRTVAYGDSCVVEAEVFPASGVFPERPGPYTFADERQAGAFVTDAVEALMYLGCDVADQ